MIADDDPPTVWHAELQTRIAQLLEPKGSSVHGREESLAAYCYQLTVHYARDQIANDSSRLNVAFWKMVKAERSEKETTSALRALLLTTITDPADSPGLMPVNQLKGIITDSESTLVKTAAIHTLSMIASFGGAGDDELEDIMTLLLEIIESDGAYISATDSAEVVNAALTEWGFLATQIDDLEDVSTPAIDAFMEQLSSTDTDVQIAAGENIALLYEKSYTEAESDEEASGSDADEDDEAAPDDSGSKLIKRYAAYRNQPQLMSRLESLAKISSKKLSKRDRRSLHTNFADILHSVEHPTRGPRYSTAIDQERGVRYGSRLVIRVGRSSTMKINRWWKLLTLKALRRALQGGFVTHYEQNPLVLHWLPVLMDK